MKNCNLSKKIDVWFKGGRKLHILTFQKNASQSFWKRVNVFAN